MKNSREIKKTMKQNITSQATNSRQQYGGTNVNVNANQNLATGTSREGGGGGGDGNGTHTAQWNYHNEQQSQLLSTVDMSAFKAGPSDSGVKNVNLSSSSTDSDESESSSDSDTSSSSDGKVKKKLTKTPQFSVTSSDSAGLRMKIAAVTPRSKTSLSNTTSSSKSSKTAIPPTSSPKKIVPAKKQIEKYSNLSSSSSCCSNCSDDSESSDSDDDDDAPKQKAKKVVTNDRNLKRINVTGGGGGGGGPLKKENKQQLHHTKKRTKIKHEKANRNGSTSSGGRTDTSESESSDELLKELDEDLASILPSAADINPPTTTSFHDTSQSANKTSQTQNKPSFITSSLVNELAQQDGASSSDTDLPALVNAAIQHIESESETESNNKMSIPTAGQYNISLLREFVAKTQMLGNNSTSIGETKPAIDLQLEKDIKTENVSVHNNNNNSDAASSVAGSTSGFVVEKKKRGRPKKPTQLTTSNSPTKGGKVAVESPDSGILSTPQSPVTITDRSPRHNVVERRTKVEKNKAERKEPPPSTSGAKKLNLTRLEKEMYATERVLYPPRGQSAKKRIARSKSTSAATSSKKDELVLDPLWRKIDITKKFRRPSTSGYKSDGGSTVCSKKLAAQSGYVSDYSSFNHHNKVSSGYKSDYSTKSRKSGYRSDYSMRAKSCGYRSDCSVRHRKKVRRKRRPKTGIIPRLDVNEQDILQLACLTLGQTSEESSRDSYTPSTTIKPSILTTSFSNIANGLFASKNSSSSLFGKCSFENKFGGLNDINKKTSREILTKLCERVSKRTSGFEDTSRVVGDRPRTSALALSRSLRANSVKPSSSMYASEAEDDVKSRPGGIKMRRMSTMSRCSSRSTSSKHPLRRIRRRRLKSRSRSVSIYKEKPTNEGGVEIDVLVKSFSELWQTNPEVVAKKPSENVAGKVPTPSTPSTSASNARRPTKKRKGSEHIDSPSSTTTTTGKRRHKKATSTQSPDDHKLPLKKRHYLLTPGEKTDNRDGGGSESSIATSTPSTNDVPTSTKVAASSKAVTPKKRHLLEVPEPVPSIGEELSPIKNSDSPLTVSSTKSVDLNLSEMIQKSHPSTKSKTDIITRKKNRLEGLVSKITVATVTTPTVSPTPSVKSQKSTRPTVIRTAGQVPPPGIFEPTIDIELQIPVSTISIQSSFITKSELLDSPRLNESNTKLEPKRADTVVEALLTKTGGHLILKRKRKKYNRTGFPTLKRRKKKSIEREMAPTEEVKTESKEADDIINDRVPNQGEDVENFIVRNAVPRTPRLSVVSLEKLQGKTPPVVALPPPPAVIPPVVPEDTSIVEKARQLRARSSNMKKREHDDENELGKTKKVKGSEEKVEKKTSRDGSSDNEPLINLLTKGKKKVRELKISIRKSIYEPTQPEVKSVKRPSRVTEKVEVEKPKQLPTPEPAKLIPKSKTKVISVTPISGSSSVTARKSLRDKRLDDPPKLLNNNEIIEPKRPSKKIIRAIDTLPNAVVMIEREDPEVMALKLIKDHVIEIEHDPLPPHENKFKHRNMSPASSDRSVSQSSSKKNFKMKKNYLTAGLLSNHYKEDQTTKTPSRQSIKSDTVIPTGGLLPPPPYCERYLRRLVEDFRLPHDLWWAHENSKLPGRDAVASWNYKKLRTNVYGDVRPSPSTDHQPCSCKLDAGCPDDCLNRLVYTECRPETCPCGDKCRNQKIQKHEYAPGLERYMTDEGKGWGIRCKEPINKGEYIIEYLGEVVTEREFKDRMASIYTRDTHHYCLHLDGGLVIDGHRMGSEARFVNHSCSPNCEVQKWSVNGLSRMALFALRNIEPGEELCYDYNFSLFNPAEGQPCMCNAKDCRGVIGGKYQRVKPIEPKPQTDPTAVAAARTGRQRKRQAKKNQPAISLREGNDGHLTFQPPTVKERSIIRNSHAFLIRNLEKIRKIRDRITITPSNNAQSVTTLSAQISALRVPRTMKTRGLSLVETDPELERTARIAGILREICHELGNFKDETNQILITKLNIPSKKKYPKYFEVVKTPMDISKIEVNVEKGSYKDPKLFDADVMRIFENSIQFYGDTSLENEIVKKLKTFYKNCKERVYERLLKLLNDDQTMLKGFLSANSMVNLKNDPNAQTEDIIRCLCGLFKDEGLMIQCSKCLVWQHTECTRADTAVENYLCERCDTNPDRVIDPEIPLNEFTEEGYRYYLSLLRGDLQVRQSDTVYVLRDIPIENPVEGGAKKHTYLTIGDVDYSECDIFRVERLWKDNTGKRFVFGHHYLRPHETYHEPSRKFYPNEVIRVPLYEIVPIDLVMEKCWVLDSRTYCKGRPVDSVEEHVYICELRVDKSARLFYKNSKNQYPTCTKNYAFKKFEQPLKISKTYAPHDLGPNQPKPRKEKPKKPEEPNKPVVARKNSTSIIQLIPPPPKTLNEKRSRLENVLNTLMTRQQKLIEGSTPPLDLSYLLTGRGARLRRANATVPL